MTTRELSEHMGRIMESGCFFETITLPNIHLAEDWVMFCGFMTMLKDCIRMCESFGFVEGVDVFTPYILS